MPQGPRECHMNNIRDQVKNINLYLEKGRVILKIVSSRVLKDLGFQSCSDCNKDVVRGHCCANGINRRTSEHALSISAGGLSQWFFASGDLNMQETFGSRGRRFCPKLI